VPDTITGRVKMWNIDKNWGFIRRDDVPGTDIFFHVTKLADPFLPHEGQAVSFEIGEGREGKECAIGVRLL